MRALHYPTAGLAVMLTVSCGTGTGDGAGAWRHERSSDGPITTVHTISGTVWTQAPGLSEEASIGEAEGDEHYLLGNVSSLWADADRIYVMDRQVPTVRVYDHEGAWLLDVGRQGSGPGELVMPSSVRTHPVDGRIFVRDGSQGRLNVYSPLGEPLDTWPIRAGFMTSRSLVMTAAGDLYTPIPFLPSPDGDGRREGLVRLGPLGAAGDTLLMPDYGYEPARISGRTAGISISNNVPFAPTEIWKATSAPAIVGGVSSDYVFDIHFPDGRITRVEMPWQPVPVDPEERSWHRARAVANMRSMIDGWAWNGPEPPGVKPAYAGFIDDGAGRIWVLREGPGVLHPGAPVLPESVRGFSTEPRWTAEWLTDVFDYDGRPLGSVDLPDGFQTYPEPFISGEMVVAMVSAADDVPRVKRFRLVFPTP